MGKGQYVPDNCKELVKVLLDLGARHSIWDVFQDWLAVSAIAISNQVDLNQRKRREEIFEQIMERYTKAEQGKMAEALGILASTLYRECSTTGPVDILGQVFHALELHNKYKGQFFTPHHICEFMGQITLAGSDSTAFQKELDGKGYITVGEPCVGSGGMILGFANAMSKNHLDYKTQMLVSACDIDMKCVHMAYIQFSLLGIPATVIHGNSLTVEEWSRWYTPAYVLGGWPEKKYLASLSTFITPNKSA